MSLILDALKKAQEERKKVKPDVRSSIQTVYTKNKNIFYITLSAITGIVLLVSILPMMLRTKPIQPSSKIFASKGQPVMQRVEKTVEKAQPAEVKEPDTELKPVDKVGATTKIEEKANTKGNEKTETSAKTSFNAKSEDKTLKNKSRNLETNATETVHGKITGLEPKEIPALKKKTARLKSTYVNTSALPVNPRKEIPSASMEHTKVVVMKVDEERIMSMYNEALLETEKGRTKEAKKLYLNILSEQPNNIEVLNNLGVIAMREGNANEALMYFRRILEKKPDYTKAYNNTGIIFMREGDRKLAEEYFKKAIDMDKDGAEAYINLSGLLRHQKRYDEASRVLENLIRRGNKNPSTYLSIALIKDDMGEIKEAIKYYRFYLREGGKIEEKNKVIERLKILEESQFNRNS
ncbi:MAG: tetratricopeptide repeat protein [Proteobacteria bacterium]|nr:tetratricopeptide repeat protein [Pseudomonadota bacterium]